MNDTLPQYLLDNRSDPEVRAVLEDWLMEHNRALRSVMPTMGTGSIAGVRLGGGVAGVVGAIGDGVANSGDGVGAIGDDSSRGGIGGEGIGNTSVGGDSGVGDGSHSGGSLGGDFGICIEGSSAYSNNLETLLNPGLRIITVKNGYYPYVLVGWWKQDKGDEYQLYGARVLRRFGNKAALAVLAAKGPQSDTELLPAAELPEEFHRLDISRSIPCNPESWARDCPKPFGWDELVSSSSS